MSRKTWCIILTLGGGTTLITTLLLDHQEAIQFRAAENVIDQVHVLGSNQIRNAKGQSVSTFRFLFTTYHCTEPLVSSLPSPVATCYYKNYSCFFNLIYSLIPVYVTNSIWLTVSHSSLIYLEENITLKLKLY